MHSRAKGKSGSTRPSKLSVPAWLSISKKELEMLIVKLAKENKTTSQIGILLRDQYGVPDVKLVVGKTLSAFLKEKNLLKELPEDLTALIKKSIAIRKHLDENKHDMDAKRGLLWTESKIQRLVKYYKESKHLALTWKYDPETIRIYVE
ncbi:MAG TPA: 30S ribosomal protein S15 [Candidatus Nanoarchaeia archaeon]|nr:30S ribosomal protein S15 [Candidatus Nanoarchaeia archaeon]